ncbi:hypothetical protein F4780DRAFT_221988 [Xylariomycetidae sp. FL0641]|nr:hypothetical protein F4780DRAFT_221988 [Xylariomycetidae sp. FL0641]
MLSTSDASARPTACPVPVSSLVLIIYHRCNCFPEGDLFELQRIDDPVEKGRTRVLCHVGMNRGGSRRSTDEGGESTRERQLTRSYRSLASPAGQGDREITYLDARVQPSINIQICLPRAVICHFSLMPQRPGVRTRRDARQASLPYERLIYYPLLVDYTFSSHACR